MLRRIASPRVHALFAAWVSIVIGLAITCLSFLSARAEKSMSLYSLALLAAVDTSSSILVILFWQTQTTQEGKSALQNIKEHRYTYAIGVMMILMGILLLGDR
jgi:hypothetical protein